MTLRCWCPGNEAPGAPVTPGKRLERRRGLTCRNDTPIPLLGGYVPAGNDIEGARPRIALSASSEARLDSYCVANGLPERSRSRRLGGLRLRTSPGVRSKLGNAPGRASSTSRPVPFIAHRSRRSAGIDEADLMAEDAIPAQLDTGRPAGAGCGRETAPGSPIAAAVPACAGYWDESNSMVTTRHRLRVQIHAGGPP